MCAAKGDAPTAVQTTCDIMRTANTVSTTAHIPKDLQGIFWMKDNKVPEKLVCNNYAVFEQVQIDGRTRYMITIVRNYFWWTYLDGWFSKIIAHLDGHMGPGGMVYFVFDDMALDYGRIYGCDDGFNYEKLSPLYKLFRWTVERIPGETVAWKRGCYWLPGWFGNRFEFGSYTLVKIMDTDGKPQQPSYDEFVQRMSTRSGGLRNMMSCNPDLYEAPKEAIDAGDVA